MSQYINATLITANKKPAQSDSPKRSPKLCGSESPLNFLRSFLVIFDPFSIHRVTPVVICLIVCYWIAIF